MKYIKRLWITISLMVLLLIMTLVFLPLVALFTDKSDPMQWDWWNYDNIF